VAEGNYRASLEALRDTLAASIEEANASHRAALAKQLADVLTILSSMPGERKSAVDDLAKRRSTRRAASALPDAAGGDI
jgi:hypothetical protein